MPRGTDVREKDADLAVGDRPCRATILGLHPNGFVPFLEESGRIENQHGLVISQVFQDVGPRIIADRIGIPLCRRQQALHPVRGRVSGLFRQLSLRSTGLRRPCRLERAQWRTSGRPKWRAIRACIASNPAAQD
jgi:hypothetical protein